MVLAAAVVVVACLASRASAEGTAMAGETCSSSADCYGDKACLGGRCCTMTQSTYTGSDTKYTKCTACAESAHAYPGVCVSCETGYHVITGEETNAEIAEKIGIKPAARCTTVKPAGTTSLTLGTSSGIHAWHNEHYIRRLRVGKNEAIYQYLAINHPELVEDEYFRPHDTAVISVPQKAPEGSITRHESALELLHRVKDVHLKWVKEGHRSGQNTNNVSATITIKGDEWEEVGEWMWENKNNYNGLSVLPFSDHTYMQAPFEDCDKETYEKLLTTLVDINLDNIVEIEDNTDLKGEAACAGGACEIT